MTNCFISKQLLTLPAQMGFLWGNKCVFPLLVSLAVLAGGAEWGGGACRGGVSCCRGSSSPLGKLGGCSERCWEGTGWRLADWWSCTQMWTSVQKPCPGPDPEGKHFKQKHTNTHKNMMWGALHGFYFLSVVVCLLQKCLSLLYRKTPEAIRELHMKGKQGEQGRDVHRLCWGGPSMKYIKWGK